MKLARHVAHMGDENLYILVRNHEANGKIVPVLN
jgi:hypothetical protein